MTVIVRSKSPLSVPDQVRHPAKCVANYGTCRAALEGGTFRAKARPYNGNHADQTRHELRRTTLGGSESGKI